MTEWKDFFGNPVKLRDRIIFAHKDSLLMGVIEKMWDNMILIQCNDKHYDIYWKPESNFIKHE